MVKALLNQPSISDEVAETLLDHMYSVADVVVDAFIERQGNPQADCCTDVVPVAALYNQMLTSHEPLE